MLVTLRVLATDCSRPDRRARHWFGTAYLQNSGGAAPLTCFEFIGKFQNCDHETINNYQLAGTPTLAARAKDVKTGLSLGRGQRSEQMSTGSGRQPLLR